jgi:hypothetical protein
MRNKSFDCVEMKRKGAEAIYQKVSSLSLEQQLEYWRKGSDSLRQQIKPAKEADGELGAARPRPWPTTPAQQG